LARIVFGLDRPDVWAIFRLFYRLPARGGRISFGGIRASIAKGATFFIRFFGFRHYALREIESYKGNAMVCDIDPR
jgi:hypothetical protein